MSTYDGSQSQHWLGAPTIGLDRNEFEQAILKRFAGSADGAIAYVERIGDRQIARAQALLPFSAIVFAFLTLSDARSVLPKLAFLGALLAVVACLLTLGALYSSWGATAQFGTVQGDVQRACAQCYRRAYLLTFALCASGVATLIAALPLLRQAMPA